MRARKQQETIESPDMTPMLDVVFIMLIFFIVTTSFVKESAVDWLSMNDQPTKKQGDPTLLVNINKAGLVSLQGREVKIDALQAMIESARSQQGFSSAIVRSHDSVSTGLLVKAIDKIKLAGIVQVSVAKL